MVRRYPFILSNLAARMVYLNSEIVRRGCSKCFSKSYDESAGGTVTCFERRVGHLRAVPEETHSLHEPELQPPFSECHPCLFQEEPLHSSNARTYRPADLSERLPISWLGNQYFGESPCSWVDQVRKLERHHLYGPELVNQHIYQVAMYRDSRAKGSQYAGVENELVQQG